MTLDEMNKMPMEHHKAAIIAIAAILESLPIKIDPELVKKKVEQSNLFGPQDAKMTEYAQISARRILGID